MISADSNTGASDHSRVFWRKGRTVKFGVVHVADVLIGFTVTVVTLDYLIK